MASPLPTSFIHAELASWLAEKIKKYPELRVVPETSDSLKLTVSLSEPSSKSSSKTYTVDTQAWTRTKSIKAIDMNMAYASLAGGFLFSLLVYAIEFPNLLKHHVSWTNHLWSFSVFGMFLGLALMFGVKAMRTESRGRQALARSLKDQLEWMLTQQLSAAHQGSPTQHRAPADSTPPPTPPSAVASASAAQPSRPPSPSSSSDGGEI